MKDNCRDRKVTVVDPPHHPFGVNRLRSVPSPSLKSPCDGKEPRFSTWFIDRFIAYMTNRETDCVRRFQTILIIEMMLQHVPEIMVTLFLGGEETAERVFAENGKDNAIEDVSIWMSTKLAQDKFAYYDLGLLETKRNGDLRGARLVDKREQFFALMKFKFGREHPELKDFISRESVKMDPKFHERLARVLNQPAIEYKDLNTSELRSFLLLFWAAEHPDRKGNLTPSLCYCSDPVIAKLAEFWGVQKNVTATLVKKNWERLGLRKSSQIVFWDLRTEIIQESGRQIKKVLFSQLRHRN